jgi:hypothetical protein
MSKPFAVLFISNMAELSGLVPSVLMAMLCAKAVIFIVTAINKRTFFMA